MGRKERRMKEYIVGENSYEYEMRRYDELRELIRCKDCKFWHTSHCPMAYREYEYNRGNEPNDFCSLAVKRKE